MLGFLRSEWCPDAYIISFKLETDKNILKEKVLKSMDNYKQNLIIGNLLSSYKAKFLALLTFLAHSSSASLYLIHFNCSICVASGLLVGLR